MTRSVPASMGDNMRTFFETKLRHLIVDVELKYNNYVEMGWSTDWLVKLRHIYLKALLEEQLSNFDK